jgi:hypothetical protein
MKASKLLLAGALALAMGTLAEAQTIIHFTGSTAYRAATHDAITNSLQSGFTFAFYGSSDPAGASQVIYTGTAITNGAPVIIKTSWSGSVGGVQTVSQQLPISTWLVSTTPQGGAPGGAAVSSPTYDSPTVPDVCMSDVFQTSTPFPTPALKDNIVGVVPFKFVASTGAPASLTNITPHLAQNLFKGGVTPLALFDGNPNDESDFYVFATGRDPDSGTRMTAFAESGVGVFTIVKQYQPVITGQGANGYGGTIQRLDPVYGATNLWPVDVVNGITYPVGDAGYSSGGSLSKAMSANSTGFCLLSYLGLNDAANALANGAHELSWNGFYYSTNGVQEGQYTFWGYEHLMYRSSFTAPALTVVTDIKNRIYSTFAPISGINVNAMNVSRPTDGGAISTLY